MIIFVPRVCIQKQNIVTHSYVVLKASYNVQHDNNVDVIVYFQVARKDARWRMEEGSRTL